MDRQNPGIEEDLSFDEHDEMHFPRAETNDFDHVVEMALTRRGFLSGALVFGTAAFLVGTGSNTAKADTSDFFGFKGIAADTTDTITVPEGFEWDVVARWGDPLWSDGTDFDQRTRGTATSQVRAFGDNNDGMALFQKDGKNILVVNNEYTNDTIIFANNPDQKPQDKDDAIKSMNALGVSVVEVKENNGKWAIVKDSPFNRRITPSTPMELTGPARGHDLMKTSADTAGTVSLGTWNNCGNGRTPWGTYLACEENFNGYFTHADKDYKPEGDYKRYGVGAKKWGIVWAQVDERFDISKEPNEPNRAGYIVEIDPFNPDSTPKKRTALGRFKHENAEMVIADNGKVVVYMGDDERGEFLYRYVSNGTYQPGSHTDDLLENGTLYAAKFNDDLTGEWLALTPETTGLQDAAEIAIRTRIAASAVKATTMDRPEWVASNPNKAEIYCALTNNKNRGKKTNKGGDAMPLDAVNPREANKYGQIVRWEPKDGDHTADSFTWNLFVLAGNPTVKEGLEAGSDNVTAANMFNSPDGISFDSQGRL